MPDYRRMTEESQRLFGWDGSKGYEVLMPFYDPKGLPVKVNREVAEKYAKNGDRLPTYRLWPRVRPSANSWRTFFLDAPFGFYMTAGKIPIAAFSFDLYRSEDARIVEVLQIQPRGIGRISRRRHPKLRKKTKAEISKVWWQGLGIDAISEWAREADFAELRITAAKMNEYWKSPDIMTDDRKFDFHKALNRRLETHYDGTARSLGFALSDDGSYYYLDL